MIVYRHGAGSFSHENVELFEYLASHGYVVVTSNYFWPSSATPEPISREEEIKTEVENILVVTDFIISITNIKQDDLHFIGHSFGSQVGLFVDYLGDHPFKSFILYETTMEKLPKKMIAQYMPELDSMLNQTAERFTTRTYIISGQDSQLYEGEITLSETPKFEVFRNLKNTTFITPKTPMNHNSYLSMSMMRFHYLDSVIQADSVTLRSQRNGYMNLLSLTRDLLEERVIDTTLFKVEIPE